MKIIFFVDGYPFYLIDKLKKSGLFNSHIKMKPSFGYSVNLHHELFQGANPDELGFFGDAYLSNKKIKEPNFYIKIWDYFRFKTPFIMRVVYKIIQKITKKQLAFLPLSSISNFDFKGSYLLQISDSLKIGNDKYKVLCFDKSIKFGKRDDVVYSEAMKYIENQKGDNLLIAFTELDWISHKYGVESKEFNDRVNLLIKYIRNIQLLVKNIDASSEFVLVSDHGMVNTVKSINLNLEDRFGASGKNGVIYFYDSLYFQIWNIDNKNLYEEILAHICNLNIGKLISKNDRIQYKLTSNKFGDDLFVLDEGLTFAPNYFGYGALKAYHGYHPDTENNKGVFCSSKENIKNDEFTTHGVYSYLSKDF
jgi:hypothetical protein